MKNQLKILLGIVVVMLVVTAGRWMNFYSGGYNPPEIAEIESADVIASPMEYHPAEDAPVQGDGTVVLDLSHANNLNINDLAPLRDRLEDRDAHIIVYKGEEGALGNLLHTASAWIIVAPTRFYTAAEREALRTFVDDGGRLLLAADPTRPVPEDTEDEDYYPNLYDLFFPTSAVPAINSIADAFGILFFDDYVYNLSDNEGNYRNVRFTHFAEDHALVADLDTVVMFAAHSLHSDGIALVMGDADTRSPVRTGEDALAAAVLTAEEHVLALGDITFLTAPYHTVADNDRFLSRIADWLAVDTRDRTSLNDFPYIFNHPVDLVQISGDYLDSQLIARSGELRAYFEEADLTLTLRADAAPDHDALLVGLFEDVGRIAPLLVETGVTITATAGADNLSDEAESEDSDASNIPENADLDDSDVLTDTETLSATDVTTDTVTEEPEEEVTEEDTDTEAPADAMQGLIEIADLGTLGLQGITLYILDHGDTSTTTLVILAEDTDAVASAVERLTTSDLLVDAFAGCTQSSTVMVCSTGEAQDNLGIDEEEAEDEAEPEEPVAESKGSIFIMSGDDGLDGTRTSADDFASLLGNDYDITLWIASEDGMPYYDDLEGYDLYIIDSGDYGFDDETATAFMTTASIESGSIFLVGAQAIPSFEDEYAPLYDLEMTDTVTPVLDSLAPGDIVSLSPSASEIPALIFPDDSEMNVILMRGPDSPNAGSPVIATAVDDTGDELNRIIIAALAFYRLPEDIQREFTLNAVAWLMGEE